MRILIAYDGSIAARVAVDDLQFAGLPMRAEALVMTIADEGIPAPRSYGMVETEFVNTKEAIAKEWANEARRRLIAIFPGWDIRTETCAGSPATVILSKAESWPADLIVVGTHGHSTLSRALMGSVSMNLVREAPCTVRVGRVGAHQGPLRLLIANDGSAEADKVVDAVCARSWPPETEAQVIAVNEVLVPVNVDPIAMGRDPEDEIHDVRHRWLTEAVERSGQKLQQAGLLVSTLVEAGDPRKTLVEAARNWDADTIFVGARGLSSIERLLLGSVSSATVTHASCTVEVVR
jgi:nucleotide-binding universal stress UspA family protein